jgi:predicted amidohydrolase YtcJ
MHQANPQVMHNHSFYWVDIQKSVPGVFLDNAQFLVTVPPPTYKDLEKRFQFVVADAVSHGLTSIHDAGFDPRSLEFFKS